MSTLTDDQIKLLTRFVGRAGGKYYFDTATIQDLRMWGENVATVILVKHSGHIIRVSSNPALYALTLKGVQEVTKHLPPIEVQPRSDDPILSIADLYEKGFRNRVLDILQEVEALRSADQPEFSVLDPSRESAQGAEDPEILHAIETIVSRGSGRVLKKQRADGITCLSIAPPRHRPSMPSP